MLRKIRISLALIFLVCITLLFLDFTGTMHAWCGWMAKIQFLPAVLALNVGIIFLLIALTLVFGRVYCSVICPLGILQDVISWISGRRKSKKLRFGYSRELKWLRYVVLLIFIVALAAGLGAIFVLLDPYAAFGRIASNLFGLLYNWGNNFLAYLAERYESYAFYEHEVWLKSLPVLIVAAVSFVIIAILAWRGGRTYCNTICPVGTVLGLLSRFSILAPVIDTDKCNACSLCARRCKASCIDSKNHCIDYSRCVVCMDCIDNCKQGAISYGLRSRAMKPTPTTPTNSDKKVAADSSRRSFITATAVVATATALKAKEENVDGGLAVIYDKEVPERKTPIAPPGAISLRNMAQHCTACQLCISACPNQVLRPSNGIMTLMQANSSYERGYCRPECTRCSQVCPTGAIRPITREEKSAIQIGRAVFVRKNCLPLTEGVSCGNCARHCPVGAITMIPSDANNPSSPKIPMINTERCIGCGACENLCPARPFSAIYVEGNEVHRKV